jgi:ureidoglycolate hydrolase
LSTPFKVVQTNGNSAFVESDQGVQYKRNVTHLKKFNERKNICTSNMTNPQCIDDDENCEIIFDTNVDDKTIGDCNSEHSKRQ